MFTKVVKSFSVVPPKYCYTSVMVENNKQKIPLSPEELSLLYPRALTNDERRQRDAKYIETRNANRPKFPAFRIATRLSLALAAVLVIIAFGPHLIPTDGSPDVAKTLTFVSTAILAGLAVIYLYFTAYKNIQKLFSHKEKTGGGAFFVIYLVLLVIAFEALQITGIISLLNIEWPGSLTIVAANFLITYIASGLFVGYGRE